MRLDLFLSEANNLKAENRLLKMAVLVIGATVLFNTVLLFSAMRAQRTILVPLGLQKTVEVTGSQVSEEYMREFLRYTMNLAQNYSPATARSQFDALLALFAPAEFPKAHKAYYDLADAVESGKVTNVFYPHEMKVNHSKQRAEVSGLVRQYTGEILMENSTQTFLVDYVVVDGKVQIKQILKREQAYKEAEAAKK